MAVLPHHKAYKPTLTTTSTFQADDVPHTGGVYRSDFTDNAYGRTYHIARPDIADPSHVAHIYKTPKVAHNNTIHSKDIDRDGIHIYTEEKNDIVPERAIGISWQDPLLAISLFIGSVLAVVGHHIYYATLENTPVYSEDQQIWAIRIGTGLALLVRCGLVAAMGIVAVQQTWATLRERAVSIKGIDSMFDILDNPWSFLNLDLLVHAKILTALAAISWILPVITVITPATLSVSPQMTQDRVTTKVPSYNFSNIDGWPIYGGVGYYSGVGPEIARLFTSTYTSNSFVPQTPPFPNASYDMDFWGPSYKCSNLSEIVKTKNTPTWNRSVFNYTSLEAAFYGEIGPPSSPNAVGDATKSYLFKASAPDAMDNMILLGTSGFNPLWDDSDHNVRMVCQLYNTSFSITIRFDNGIQSIKENSVNYLKAQDWNDTLGRNSGFLDKGNCASDPKADNATICPTYYMTHYIFGNFLSGRILINVIGEVLYESGDALIGAGSAPLFQSGLMDCPEIWNSTNFLEATEFTSTFQTSNRCRGGTLAAAIENLSRNFTYSLMTYRNWQNVATTVVPVTVSSPRNFFSYDRKTLLAAYLSGVLVTLVCLCVGGIALWRNGYTSSTSFSAVLLTTRNSDLDKLAQDNTLGAKPLPNLINGTKLRFGILKTGGSETQTGFGFDGTVEPLKNTPRLKHRRKGTD